MKTESEIPDNQKTKNYFIAIIIAVIYVLATYSDALTDMMFFIPTVIGILVVPAIFAGIYYLVKRKGFSKVFAWATVIMCVMSYFNMSYFNNSSKSDSSPGHETTNYTDYELNKVPTKENKISSPIHPTKQPYDATANIFEENSYTKEKLLKIIEALGGPVTFRKEKNKWYLYTFDDRGFFYYGTRFKVFRVPVDTIYKQYNTWEYSLDDEYTIFNAISDSKILDPKNSYCISYINHIDDIVNADCRYKNGDFYNCKLLSNEIEIDDFGFNVNSGNLSGDALAHNTTINNITNIKIKISVYTEAFGGELITEDICIIKDSLQSGQMKVIDINYSPKESFEAKGLTPMNLEILEYDKF